MPKRPTQTEKDKLNQKYIIAVSTLPANCYTIEKYVKEILRADLTQPQLTLFGKIATKEATKGKIPPKYVRHPIYVAVRYYDKIFLDAVLMEFLRQQNE